MNLKKKLKAFFTLKRRQNGGFTLVELIVVIAILAILAGVGTAGYSGYIKNANKNSDKVLVGNIMRAIETGTNSTMFASDDSFKKAATTYPVGVIVLSMDEGCEVASTSSKIQSSTSTCVLATETFVTEYSTKDYYNSNTGLLEKLGQILGFVPPAHLVEYTISKSEPVEYCTTHSNLPPSKTVYTKVEQKSTILGKYYDDTAQSTVFLLDDCKGMYALAKGHTQGGSITTDNIVKDETADNRVSVDNDSVIKGALQAAFGEDLTDLSLVYDGWGDVDASGHTYPTLYTYTETMIQDIKDTANLLITAKNTVGNTMDLDGYLSDTYNNSADMMDSFSNHISQNYANQDAWMTEWNKAADASDDRCTFGLNSKLDFIYAARIAYNSAFASYCDANGADKNYLEVIKDYSNKDSQTGLLDIPCVTNSVAFNADQTNEESLYQKFVKAGDTEGKAFEQYKALFEQYKTSESCIKNGETFYSTMKTVAQTGSEAFSSGNVDDYFKYYENMMQEMAAYYQLIEAHEGEGIVILVTVEEGVVKCDVSPAAANPRND